MNKGSYQIYLYISKDIEVKIGSLGLCSFPEGRYIYTGSAMKNLAQRIARHQKKIKKRHWHIDYLLENHNTVIEKIEIFPSLIKEECDKNMELIEKQKAISIIKKFGSSDCKKCPSHLLKLI